MNSRNSGECFSLLTTSVFTQALLEKASFTVGSQVKAVVVTRSYAGRVACHNFNSDRTKNDVLTYFPYE